MVTRDIIQICNSNRKMRKKLLIIFSIFKKSTAKLYYAMTPMHVFTRNIHRPGIFPDIVIETDSDEFAGIIRKYFAGYLADAPDERCKTMTILKSGDGRAITVADPLSSVAEFLHFNINIISGYMGFHASVVEFGGKAYLFATSTGSGKTTLAAYLIHNGFGYLSDDMAIIDTESLGVLSVGNTIHLRRGGLDVLRAADVALGNIEPLGTGEALRYPITPKTVAAKAVPLGGIFFPRLSDKNFISPAASTSAISALMKYSIVPVKPSREYLLVMTKLCKAPCFFAEYRDMGYIADFIKGGLPLER